MVKGSFFSLKKSEAGEKKLLTWGPIRERLSHYKVEWFQPLKNYTYLVLL